MRATLTMVIVLSVAGCSAPDGGYDGGLDPDGDGRGTGSTDHRA